jgi:hypothetical protein
VVFLLAICSASAPSSLDWSNLVVTLWTTFFHSASVDSVCVDSEWSAEGRRSNYYL